MPSLEKSGLKRVAGLIIGASTSRDPVLALMEVHGGPAISFLKYSIHGVAPVVFFPPPPPASGRRIFFGVTSNTLRERGFRPRAAHVHVPRPFVCTRLFCIRLMSSPPANSPRKILAAESRRRRFSKYNSSHATARCPR